MLCSQDSNNLLKVSDRERLACRIFSDSNIDNFVYRDGVLLWNNGNTLRDWQSYRKDCSVHFSNVNCCDKWLFSVYKNFVMNNGVIVENVDKINKKKFLEDLSKYIRRSIPASPDMYCTQSNGIEVSAYAMFNSKDLNQFANASFVSKNYDKTYNAKWRVGTRMRGRTQLGRHGFAFPVLCTRREFISFIEQMLEVSSTERKALFQDGVVLTEKVGRLYGRVFPKGSLANPYALEREDIFNGISAISSIVLFLEAAYKKDVHSLGLLCMQQIKVIAPVAEYMGSSLVDFKDEVVRYLHAISPYSDDDKTGFPWISLLPGVVRQSPLVQRLIALATFMMSASFVTDSSIWQYLIGLVGPSFENINSRAKGAVLLIGVVSALWEGFRRMESFTDIRTLIGLSKDGAFTESVRDIKLLRESSISDEEATELINRIDGLLLSRRGLVNSPAISRMCDYLVDKKKEIIRFTQDYTPREKPIVLWFNGPPGSGKTTFIDGLKNFLAVKDGIPRKRGDTVLYNISDKYPAEMSHNYDSRYMEINDIPAVYTDYAKNGYVPLDVLLQQVIDTSPLTFQAAFQKGIIYNHIKYVFITSNHDNYKFSGDIQKLNRRMDDSILINMGFDRGTYADVASQDVKFRNDRLRFNVLKAKTTLSGILSFQRTSLNFTYEHIVPYIERRIDTLCLEREQEYNRFNTIVCTCGMAKAHHLYNGVPRIISERCDLTTLQDTDLVDETVPTDYSLIELDANFEVQRRVVDIELMGPELRPAAVVRLLGELIPDLYDVLDRLRGIDYMVKIVLETEDIVEKVDVALQPYVERLVGLLRPEPVRADVSDALNPFTFADPDWWAEPRNDAQAYSLLYTSVGAFGVMSFLYSYAPRLNTVQALAYWFKLHALITVYNFIIHYVCAYLMWRHGNDYETKVRSIYYKLKSAVAKVQLFIANHSVAIAGLGVTALFGYTMYNRHSSRPMASVQGVTRHNYDSNSLTTSMKRTEQSMTTNNRSWAREGPLNVVELKTFNVNSEDLLTKVKRATIKAKIAPAGDIHKHRVGYIFVLSSMAIVVNKHYLVNDDREFVNVVVQLDDGSEFILFAEDYKEFPGVEAIVVDCTEFPHRENLSKFLPTNNQVSSSYDGIYAPTGEKVVIKGSKQVTLKENYGTYFGIECRLDTKGGDCGNVLIGTINGNAFIAGILFAGEPSDDGHITYFSPIPAAEHVASRVVIPEPSDLGPVDAGSEIANDPHRELNILGTNPNEGKQGFRTAFQKTRLYPFVHDRLSEEYRFPQKIAGNISLDPKVYVHGSAWRNTFKNFDLINRGSNAIFFEAACAYVQDFPEDGPLAPLTLEQAMFGEPSIGVEAFPMNTSAGPYWRQYGCKKKKDLFAENSETGLYEILPEFRDAVENQLRMLGEHVVVAPHVEMAAKDEIRPARKLNEYKVRLFSVVDADYNVVIRMYLMPLIVYLMKHKTHSECYGQMHAASKQWTELKNYLTEPGFTKFADMDFTAFDTCHDSKVFRAVALVLFMVAMRVGYPLEEAQKVKTLVESMSVQLTQYKGDYFVKTKGMPSGVILTLVMNSIANSLLMRVVYKVLTELPMTTFRDNVRLATVGDDNIHSFSDSIAGAFTMTRAQEIYEQLGYIITPASKEGQFVDVMALEDLVFVKRKFVKWADGFYRAPLDKDSIYKSFCFERKSGPESATERLRSVYGSAVREAYLHGREFFDEFVEFMSDLYHKHDLPFDRLTFDELNDKFLEEGLITGDA